jgi:hypothetical protein
MNMEMRFCSRVPMMSNALHALGSSTEIVRIFSNRKIRRAQYFSEVTLSVYSCGDRSGGPDDAFGETHGRIYQP